MPASSSIRLPSDPSVLLAAPAQVFRSTDLAIVNLEGQLTDRGVSKCGGGRPGCFSFRSPPEYAKTVFADAGIDVVAVANNHSYDYGDEGRADTYAALAGAGIARTGLDNDIAVVERAGLRIAIVAFAPYRFTSNYHDEPAFTETIRRARSQADLVVVALHAGAEGSDRNHTPDSDEYAFGENRGNPRRVAHLAIDAGADLVVGAGPHTVRGVEAYKDKLIAYSTGNLVGYSGALTTGGGLSLSAVLEVRLRGDGTFESGTMHPLLIDDMGVPQADPAGTTLHVMRTVSSDDFGDAAVTIADDGTLTLP